MAFDYIAYLVLPTLIFLARVADVSIGTIRLIFVAKGMKNISPILGFFEVLIYIIAMQKVLSNMTSPWLYVVYAAGFAAGNYVGICIEEKLSIGKVMVRIITQKRSRKLLKNLKEKDYRLTVTDGVGKKGKVRIIFLVINKKKLKKLLKLIKETDPKAFYSIEEVKYAKDEELLQTTSVLQNPKFYMKKK
jgi:uncharacterized protein YebE (UPF0316 family)